MTENIDLKEREFIDNHPILLTHTVSILLSLSR